MKRRDFFGLSAAAAAGLLLRRANHAGSDTRSSRATGDAPQHSPQRRIPRWRGFNLTELTGGQRDRHFLESDFEWMAGWGFTFARLPLNYWAWSDRADWLRIEESRLEPVDQAIEWGRQYGVHVNLCLHRIPGYCVNQRELEPYQLFDSPRDSMERALEAARHHWRVLAQRYQGVPAEQLSFDLFNEPPWMQDQSRYVEVARALVATIREQDGKRLIFADGADIGQTPVPGLFDLGLVHSTRGYLPKMVSHYTAAWVPSNEFESFARPTWPMTDAHGRLWNRETLRQELIEKWKPVTDRGLPVHVGEWGCFSKTPHDVTLAWMSDLLALWREAGWGWSMWNLRGSFGPVDSGREDVAYEDFQGHKLDRKMLELLRSEGAA